MSANFMSVLPIFAAVAYLGWIGSMVVAAKALRSANALLADLIATRTSLIEARGALLINPIEKHQEREAGGPLPTKLLRDSGDLVEFIREIIARAPPESPAMLTPFTWSGWTFPCHAVAIPDGDGRFDIQRIARDPAAELAELEDGILRAAAALPGADAPRDPNRL